MFRLLLLLHLIAFALSLGALVCQTLLVAGFFASPDFRDRFGSERMSSSIARLIQSPGVYLAMASGLGLLWSHGWEPISQGWLQFKLLFVFWIWLSIRLMRRNHEGIRALRDQCGPDDSDRLKSLKGNHLMIAYVTLFTFLFVMIFSIWKPF